MVYLTYTCIISHILHAPVSSWLYHLIPFGVGEVALSHQVQVSTFLQGHCQTGRWTWISRQNEEIPNNIIVLQILTLSLPHEGSPRARKLRQSMYQRWQCRTSKPWWPWRLSGCALVLPNVPGCQHQEYSVAFGGAFVQMCLMQRSTYDIMVATCISFTWEGKEVANSALISNQRHDIWELQNTWIRLNVQIFIYLFSAIN